MSENARLRRETIRAMVCERGRVTVHQLVSELAVSEATVRRDLRRLAGERLIEPVLGGGALPRVMDFSFQSKGMRNIEAKRVIGRLAAGLVEDHDQILLDSGTTCFQMAPHLLAKRNLCVIANSTRLAMELNGEGVEVVLLGGKHRPERMDTVGPLAMETLKGIRGYKAFIGADGLAQDFGVTASDLDSAHLYSLAVANSRETILVVDHTKFLNPSLFRIVGFDAVSRIVTDQPPSPEWMAYLEERGIELILPAQEGPGVSAGEPE
ncbi:MAG: DeoR/GlpR family DNA-binding transcription regulator [Candidatus Sumerlaeota bacterium]|nr:DeoR/GlpR family DNA-binding transcription regulator [Candidatus Sumerlaeota bacterium]